MEIKELPAVKNSATELVSNGIQMVDINKRYLIDISEFDPLEISNEEHTISDMSLVKIDKITYNKDEDINDKLVSVYNAMYNFGSTALLLITSDAEGGRILSWNKA